MNRLLTPDTPAWGAFAQKDLAGLAFIPSQAVNSGQQVSMHALK
jgi:hypothetical protein